MPERPVPRRRKITKAKLKAFIKRYKKEPESILHRILPGYRDPIMARLSPSRIVVVKKEKDESQIIKAVYTDWVKAVKKEEIKPKHYQLKRYAAYPINSSGTLTHTIATYHLRPSIQDISDYFWPFQREAS